MAGPDGRRRRSRVFGAMCTVMVLAVAVAGTGPRTAFAQAPSAPAGETAAERDRTLDALFHGLKAAGGDDEAEPMVERIWEVWSRSGRRDVDFILEQGVGLLAIGHLAAARDRFTEAIEAAPAFAEAWNKRATVLFLMNEDALSLADIEKVLALEPRHFGALAGRGMIHARAGRWQDALDDYRKALAVNPFLKERASIIPELERRTGEKPL